MKSLLLVAQSEVGNGIRANGVDAPDITVATAPVTSKPARAKSEAFDASTAFGKTALSVAAKQLYIDAQKFADLSHNQAFKLANAWMRDYGMARERGEVTVKYGKIDKEGVITLRDATKGIKVACTNSLRAAKLVAMADELAKSSGAVDGQGHLVPISVKIELPSPVMEFLGKSE